MSRSQTRVGSRGVWEAPVGQQPLQLRERRRNEERPLDLERRRLELSIAEPGVEALPEVGVLVEVVSSASAPRSNRNETVPAEKAQEGA